MKSKKRDKLLTALRKQDKDHGKPLRAGMFILLLVIVVLGIWLSVERNNNVKLEKQIAEKDETIALQEETIAELQSLYDEQTIAFEQFKIDTAGTVTELQNKVTKINKSLSWFIDWGWGISDDADETDNLCGEGFIPRLLNRIAEFEKMAEEIKAGMKAPK